MSDDAPVGLPTVYDETSADLSADACEDTPVNEFDAGDSPVDMSDEAFLEVSVDGLFDAPVDELPYSGIVFPLTIMESSLVTAK